MIKKYIFSSLVVLSLSNSMQAMHIIQGGYQGGVYHQQPYQQVPTVAVPVPVTRQVENVTHNVTRETTAPGYANLNGIQHGQQNGQAVQNQNQPHYIQVMGPNGVPVLQQVIPAQHRPNAVYEYFANSPVTYLAKVIGAIGLAGGLGYAAYYSFSGTYNCGSELCKTFADINKAGAVTSLAQNGGAFLATAALGLYCAEGALVAGAGVGNAYGEMKAAWRRRFPVQPVAAAQPRVVEPAEQPQGQLLLGN